MANILALAVFGTVLAGEKIGLFESPEVQAQRAARREVREETQTRERLEHERIEREQRAVREREARERAEAARRQRESVQATRDALEAACLEAKILPKTERHVRASEIKKEFIAFLDGAGRDDVGSDWAQTMSRKIRLLKQ